VCGIAGIVGAPPDPGLLQRMADTMRNRGPDGEGTWIEGDAGLAFRRLAIIDLHERSNQPLHLGSLHLVFNGELYNYRELRAELAGRGHSFETEGDGEVLLHAWREWGEGALERFDGMFAFAVWDAHERRLTLACDPFGEKPLYWTRGGPRLLFASELEALLLDPDVPRRPEHEALARYVARDEMPAPERSFFEGVWRLPAAHVLRFAGGRVETARYWRPRRVDVPADPREAARELRGLLLDSVRLRLRSDVPVGTSLSGGLDSSAVVALSAELAGDHRRHAFTARFPGFDRDEWRYAQEAARGAGVVEHYAVEPRAEELLDDLPRLVRDHEEPVRSSSIYAQWRVMEAAREAGVTVLLDGQGADELLAGYRHLWGPAVRSLPLREAAGAVARDRSLVAPVALSLGYERLPGPAARAYRRLAASPYADRSVVAEAARGAALYGAGPLALDGAGAGDGAAATPLGRALLRDTFALSLPPLLRYADRSSMAHSREVRLPYLDRRLAEFALSMPAGWIYRGGRSKWILRAAVADAVPRSIVERRDKIGFETPQHRWLHEPAFMARLGEVLLDPAARARGLYRAKNVERDVSEGRWRDVDAIWRALNAELWLRELVERR